MAKLGRKYQGSHPWLTFRVDLTHAGARVWMMLGEARSKVDHLSLSLLKPETAAEMLLVYLTKGAQATAAIEGNTLTEDEVAAIVEGRAPTPRRSREYLHREVENIVAAFNEITGDLMTGAEAALTPVDVLRFNGRVLNGLDEPDVTPGQIRTKSVVVGSYQGAPAEDCEYLVERLCEWMDGPDFDPVDADWKVPLALVKAVVAHLYVAWIHPFDNGNGRTARLIELQILLAAGVPAPAAHLLSNHYNATRDEYYRQLAEASRSGGDVVPFLRYAVQGFVDGLRAQLERVWDQQYADRWEQFIYETFGGPVTSAADLRRLELAKRLSEPSEPVARRDIPGLSVALGVAYHTSARTLNRDLNVLVEMGLIESTGRGLWRARREQILAFRPLRRGHSEQ